MNLVTLQGWLDNTSFAILFLSMLVYWGGVAFPNNTLLPIVGTTGMAIANLCMATLLGARWIDAGYFPLSNLYESLFFVAWGITAVHLLAENMSRSRFVGAVTAPVAMGITAFAALTLPDQMQVSEPLVPALKSNWLMMHVSVMLLSYAALMVGALLAIAFLVVTRGQEVVLRGSSYGAGSFRIRRAGDAALSDGTENGLKNGVDTSAIASINSTTMATKTAPSATMAPTTMASATTASATTASATTATATVIPNTTATATATPGTETATLSAAPLKFESMTLADTLDNISYRMIGLGFPLLTIGIIAGGVWANEAWGSYWSWDPKETWALITWLVFAAYLHARITRGWQGRRPAILAASGFLVVWVCYLGVNLLGKGLHSYGWFF
ncbi:MAG: c-type cytochrome biogenesis protein CcsB [Merismopedia sp. SIO2A8]|nr:c-type cytochrome biogenesis protein CcsB [Symploca sp. SIO2B6]NET48426.1 c-type cytochrome biogenesis protein CcsB [Merismopedia sp. SIO2A8]